jgi:hypothetical protein
MYDLATKLEQIDLNEATTISDIAYLPSSVGAVKAALQSLAKMKKDWGIEILEDKEGKKVVFEDAVSIYVPHTCWNDFSTLFDWNDQKTVVGLQRYLAEAFEKDLQMLQSELKVALTRMFSSEPFEALNMDVDLWKARFGVVKRDAVNKVAVSVEYKEKDIEALDAMLQQSFKDTRGNFEMLINALRNQEPLTAFKVFQKYSFLYGTRLYSKLDQINLIYEAVIDFTYLPQLSIMIDDQDVVDAIEEQVRDIKVVKNVIFPQGNSFGNATFREIQMVIENIDEKEDLGKQGDQYGG